MAETPANTRKNVLGIGISGEVSDKDARKLSRKIEETAARFGEVRVLLTLKHYASLNTAESLYDDLRFIKWHADKIEKMAVVGDAPWKTTWVALFGLFGGIDCRYFSRNEGAEAVAWLS